MKIIISHDVDHYYLSDHLFKDLYLPKHVIKNIRFFLLGKISFSLLKSRMKLLTSNKMSRLDQLMQFNLENDVPASYFIGVSNALNLSYSNKTAQKIIKTFAENNLNYYIHGINYDDPKQMELEKQKFQDLDPTDKVVNGIRMHYLRNGSQTCKILSELGYLFDSTRYELENPYLVGNMIEFPVSMMEVYMITYSEMDFAEVQKRTINRIYEAQKKDLKYFCVIFHDHHFSDSFPLHHKWYKWLIRFFKENDYEFIDFEKAMKELKK